MLAARRPRRVRDKRIGAIYTYTFIYIHIYCTQYYTEQIVVEQTHSRLSLNRKRTSPAIFPRAAYTTRRRQNGPPRSKRLHIRARCTTNKRLPVRTRLTHAHAHTLEVSEHTHSHTLSHSHTVTFDWPETRYAFLVFTRTTAVAAAVHAMQVRTHTHTYTDGRRAHTQQRCNGPAGGCGADHGRRSRGGRAVPVCSVLGCWRAR